MLISESRFRKIINEELKKLMKEATPVAATTPSAPAAPDAKLEAQAKITRQQKVGALDLFFKNAANFLAKHRGAGTPNVGFLTQNWAKIKANPDPPPGVNIGDWLYGGSITAIVSRLVDVKKPSMSLFQVLCSMSGNGGADIQNLDAKALFKRFSGKEMFGADNKMTPEATEFQSSLGTRGAKGVIADLFTFLMPDTAMQALAKSAAARASAAPVAGSPQAAPGAAGVAPAQGFTYTIKQGDTITKILQAYYGFNPQLWNTLQQADVQSITNMFGTNNPNVIVPRKTVNLLPSIVLGGKTYQLKQPAAPQQPAPAQPTVAPIGRQPIVNRP